VFLAHHTHGLTILEIMNIYGNLVFDIEHADMITEI